MGFPFSVSKCLMKWRDPKIKGILTRGNLVVVVLLVLGLSIPFGFLGGGPGTYSVSTALLALAFMSAGAVGLCILPLLPGAQIQLREDAIVRLAPRVNQKAAYTDIECCYFYRDCSYSMHGNTLLLNVSQKSGDDPRFTSFEVIMKDKSSWAALRSIKRFAVPGTVNLDSVLEILREKGVSVVEPAFPG